MMGLWKRLIELIDGDEPLEGFQVGLRFPVAAQYAHTQSAGFSCEGRSEVSQADNEQRLSIQFEARSGDGATDPVAPICGADQSR